MAAKFAFSCMSSSELPVTIHVGLYDTYLIVFPCQSRETPRKYVLWGAIQYFAGQRYILAKLQNACNFYIVIAASLVDSEKDTKLRAHTVNLLRLSVE